MSDELHDTLNEDDGSVPGEDLIVKLALVGGGLFIVREFVQAGFENKEAGRLKEQEEEIRGDLRAELEDPDAHTDGELQTKIAVYKNMVQSENQRSVEGCEENVAEIENALQGQSLETQALTWKTVAHRITVCRLANVASRSNYETWWNSLPEWTRNYIKLGFVIGGSAALIALINRLIDFGRGGGGSGIIGLLGDAKEMARNGIYGSPGMVEDIESTPPPAETPTPEPPATPSEPPAVSGSIRSAGEILGVPDKLLIELLNIMGWPGAVIVYVSPQAVQLILDNTSLTREKIQTPAGAAALLLIAVALAAAVVLAAADGPLPAGDAAGVALVATVAAAVGVSIQVEKVLDLARSVAGGVQRDA